MGTEAIGKADPFLINAIYPVLRHQGQNKNGYSLVILFSQTLK